MTSDQAILTAVGAFAFGVVGLVVGQYHLPHAFRPLSILGAMWRAFQQARSRRKESRARASEAHAAHLMRPCWRCQATNFRNEVRLIGRPSGTLLVEALVIIFILTPLTCGFALILLLLINNKKREKVQVCLECGAERPMD